MNAASKKTIKQLKLKISDDKRMPSIANISAMLTDLGINHYTNTSVNIVERRSAGAVYVNDRYAGKEGKKLEIAGVVYMDSSESYYSWNTRTYAKDIINYLSKLGKI